MVDFITTIVVEGGTPDDYLAVDLAMKNCHFTNRMRSAFGVSYKLPRGSYFSQSSDMAASDVRNLALVATRSVKRHSDIVTVAGTISFFLSPDDGKAGSSGTPASSLT